MKMKRHLAAVLAVLLIAALMLSACGSGGGTGSGSPSVSPSGEPSGEVSGTESAEPSASGELVETGYQADMEKDVIKIRGVRSLTGGLAIFEQTAFGPQYKMWEEEINASGGLYVKSLDRKVPVEIEVTDDGSDYEKTTQLMESILANEKPDLVLAPDDTALLFATAPIVQKYGYLMISAEGGAKRLEEQFEDMRADYGTVNVFSVLSYSETQVPALVKLLQELEVTTVYIAYINDLHGLEYFDYSEEQFEAAGIEIVGSEPVDPADPKGDVVINNAMNSGAQAFLGYMYPQQGIPVTISARSLNYNPEMYLLGPGLCYDFFSVMAFGDYTQDSLTGIMGWGAWNEKSSESAKEYSEHFREFWTEKGLFWRNEDGTQNTDAPLNQEVYQDWWGHICYYSVMQILQQAVENAGELDENGVLNQATLVEYINNNTFDTVMNPELKFTDNILQDDMYLGNIGQWQDGVFEVIDADDRRTADPIFPKPEWWQG